MDTLILSEDYKIEIPEEVRKKMSLEPMVKLQMIVFDGRIELIPVRPMAEMRGFLKGFDPEFKREGDEKGSRFAEFLSGPIHVEKSSG